MKKLLIPFFVIFSSCSKNSDKVSSQKISSSSNLNQADESLVEFGDEGTDEEIIVDTFYPSTACDVFQTTDYVIGDMFSEMYPKKKENCSSLSEKHEQALRASSQVAFDLYANRVDDNSAKCESLSRRFIRKFNSYLLGKEKLSKQGIDEKLIKNRTDLIFSRLSRTSNKLFYNECISEPVEIIKYTHYDNSQELNLDKNYVTNGSFEIFKSTNGDKKKTTYLEDGWTIVNNINAPGWRIKSISNENDNIDCAYLEIQKSGVSSFASNGDQLVELDSHCTNSDGRRVSGNSNIEIFQRFPVTSIGSYRLILDAKKRSGLYGNLETSIYQNKKDKTYLAHTLPFDDEWNQVCHQFDVNDTSSLITFTIKDNGDDGKDTMGLLVDNVIFEKGDCLEL